MGAARPASALPRLRLATPAAASGTASASSGSAGPAIGTTRRREWFGFDRLADVDAAVELADEAGTASEATSAPAR
jgi:hypothetical protein